MRQDLFGQRAVLLRQIAHGGRRLGGVVLSGLRLLHLLLQLLAGAVGNALVQPGHTWRALQQLAALGLQLHVQQALAGFYRGLLFLAQRQLLSGAAVFGIAAQLARLGQCGRFAGFGRHRRGRFLHALLQGGQVRPAVARLGHQVGLLGRRFLDTGLERGDRLALVSQQLFQHFLAGIGRHTLFPAGLDLAQLLVAQRRRRCTHGGLYPAAQAFQRLRQRIGLLLGRGRGLALRLDGALLVRATAAGRAAAQARQRRQRLCGRPRCQGQQAGAQQQPQGRQPPAWQAPAGRKREGEGSHRHSVSVCAMPQG